MKSVIIACLFLPFNVASFSQAKQMTTSSKSKTTKSTSKTGSGKKLKAVPDNHSGPGIENTGTTHMDIHNADKTLKSNKSNTTAAKKATPAKKTGQ